LPALAALCRNSDSGKRALEEIRQAIHVDGITEFAPALSSGEDIHQRLTLSPRSFQTI
jgi:hypothetical protein